MSEIAIVEAKRTGGEAKHQTREKISRDKMDMAVAMRCSELLQRFYPKHSWRVEADTRTGLVTVLNMSLSGRFGFVLHLRKIGSAADLGRKVMRAGGDLLERFRLSRLGFDPNEYMLLERDEIGRPKFDGNGAEQ